MVPLMTGREKLEAEEMKRHLISLSPMCAVCGEAPSTQLAHRISKSKANIKRYGAQMIHHPLNLVPVCGLRCNSSVLIDGNPGKKSQLLGKIHDALFDGQIAINEFDGWDV